MSNVPSLGSTKVVIFVDKTLFFVTLFVVPILSLMVYIGISSREPALVIAGVAFLIWQLSYFASLPLYFFKAIKKARKYKLKLRIALCEARYE